MLSSKTTSTICGLLALALTVVTFTAWATKHAVNGGPRFSGEFKSAVLIVADLLPRTKGLIGLINNIRGPTSQPEIYSYIKSDYSPVDRINMHLLVSSISSKGLNQITLIDLQKNKSHLLAEIDSKAGLSIYSDKLIGDGSYRQSPSQNWARVWHPYLFKTGKIVYSLPWNDLVCFDLKTQREEWRILGTFHHSIEVDGDGNIWACASIESKYDSGTKMCPTKNFNFEDQLIIKASENGKILDCISVAELIVNSGLEHLLFGVSNINTNCDPLHLNQVTPITSDQGFLRKGMLLVSLRNLSAVLLIDPVRKKIIWHQIGPWMNQHSVQVYGKSKICVLDNHSFASGSYWADPSWESRILVCNIESREVETVKFSDMGEKLRIAIEGRVIPVNESGWMIEDSVFGTVLIYNNGKLVFKWVNRYPDSTVGLVSWARLVDQNQLPLNIIK